MYNSLSTLRCTLVCLHCWISEQSTILTWLSTSLLLYNTLLTVFVFAGRNRRTHRMERRYHSSTIPKAPRPVWLLLPYGFAMYSLPWTKVHKSAPLMPHPLHFSTSPPWAPWPHLPCSYLCLPTIPMSRHGWPTPSGSLPETCSTMLTFQPYPSKIGYNCRAPHCSCYPGTHFTQHILTMLTLTEYCP